MKTKILAIQIVSSPARTGENGMIWHGGTIQEFDQHPISSYDG